MTPKVPNLRNRSYFPPFSKLPFDQDVPASFYELDSGMYQPKKHWCFFAQIIARVPWPIRPMYQVKDMDGQTLLVAFHLDDRSRFPHIEARCQVGHTLAFMYANRHHFSDGQKGIRVETEETFTVLPCDLQGLLAMGDSGAGATPKCSVCGKSPKMPCALCQAQYCSDKCQIADLMKRGHAERACAVRCQFLGLGDFNWGQFDHFRSFRPPEPGSSSAVAPRAPSRSVSMGVVPWIVLALIWLLYRSS
ncbi:hypothetical protein BD779DRAFT_1586819 [Infundibulicybe gibba]|nr:hypothetical protein BD779DRAFT_1586819 [Infundibulicybe gibba]